jgi:TonB-dependent starch-binding outer membrane protein SusC
MDEQGVVINSSYRRFSSRLKIDTDIKKKLTAGTTLNLSYEFQKGLNENTVFQQLAERIPYFPIFEPDGSFTPEIAGRQNPVAEAAKTRRDTRNFRAQSFNFAQLQILPSLNFKSTLGINFRYGKVNNFDPTIVQVPGNPATGSERQILDHDFQHENYFTYKKKFANKHNVQAIAGMQVQRWNNEESRLTATAFLSDNIQTFNNVREFNLGQTTSDKSQHSLLAYFGDLSYDYKGKYLLKGTLRRDGSSRFGADRRYGLFPSGSIGWRISSEKFMNKISDQISNLMVRFSYGATGNERINDYESRFLYQAGAFYNALNGVPPVQIANPLLGWESTVSTNLGIDASLLRNRLSIMIDFWDKTTKDLLYDVPLPEETGFRSVRQNIGSVQNKGIDISLSGSPIKHKSFEWFSSFNITFLKNKVLELAQGTEFESGNFIIREGQPLGNVFGYVYNGIFPYNESNAFTNNGEQLTPVFDDGGKFKNYNLGGSPYTGTVNQIKVGDRVLGGGDIWWSDLNNDFLIDGAKDRTVIGNGLPDFFGGFFNELRYKGVSLGVLVDYSFGNDIFRNYDQQRNDLNAANETPAPERITGAWLKAGDIAEYPSLDRNRTQNRLGPSSQYINKGDFVKWRSVRLNYNLPQSFYKRATWISNVSFNFSVNNLMTFTNYPGYNPELGSRGNPLQPGQDNLRYPNKRDFVLGVKAQF